MDSKLDYNDIYKQADNTLLEDMDGELLLYHPTTAVTLHLNGPSAVVWQLCDGEKSCGDIIQLVEQAYPQQAAQIADDVGQVITDLAQRKVLQKVG